MTDQTRHKRAHKLSLARQLTMLAGRVSQVVDHPCINHESPTMTQRYAAMHDKTLKQAFDKYRERVTTEGKVIVYEPDSPMTEGMRLNDRLKRARQTLANGYCAAAPADRLHPSELLLRLQPVRLGCHLPAGAPWPARSGSGDPGPVHRGGPGEMGRAQQP